MTGLITFTLSLRGPSGSLCTRRARRPISTRSRGAGYRRPKATSARCSTPITTCTRASGRPEIRPSRSSSKEARQCVSNGSHRHHHHHTTAAAAVTSTPPLTPPHSPTSLTQLTPLDQPRTAPDIPTGWWHEIETPGLTLSVNVFFPGSEAARLRSSMLGLMSDRYLQFIAARSGGGGVGGGKSPH